MSINNAHPYLKIEDNMERFEAVKTKDGWQVVHVTTHSAIVIADPVSQEYAIYIAYLLNKYGGLE